MMPLYNQMTTWVHLRGGSYCLSETLEQAYSYFFWQSLFFFFFFWLHHETCRILVPWPVIESVPLAMEVQSLNHWITREIPSMQF